jgi:hypothetical protein
VSSTEPAGEPRSEYRNHLIDLQNLIIDRIPSDEGSDIMWWMMFHFRDGAILPFMAGLLERLVLGDYASTGYAERAIDRIAEIPESQTLPGKPCIRLWERSTAPRAQ